MRAFFVIVFLIILLAPLYFELKDEGFDNSISSQIKDAVTRAEGTDNALFDRSAYTETIEKEQIFTEEELNNSLSDELGSTSFYYTKYWQFDDGVIMAASASGTDHIHHFVNGYLLGYEPFKTEHLWVPLYAISSKLKYQLDSNQYNGLTDVWQTSKQAFMNTRGDCEDHALVLADWLIEMGLDARVAIGEYHDGGHAWVVVFKDSEVYLLEGTDKLKKTHWRYYPLAKFAAEYRPMYMFNRNYFWANTGSKYTTDYEGSNWIKRSRYYKSSNG